MALFLALLFLPLAEDSTDASESTSSSDCALDFFAPDFLLLDFLLAPFFAAPDLAVPLLAAPFFPFFFDGPAAALASSNETACSKVSSSPERSFGSDALVSPSVTYKPYRPSRSSIAFPVTGDTSRVFSGGAATPRPCPRVGFGCARMLKACSNVISRSGYSAGIDRESLPCFRNGPKRPWVAMIGSPSSG